MAYQKQNFVDGNVLTADNLNYMEDGIAAAAPAGYGLGEIDAPIITTDDQLDATVTSGFYRIAIAGKTWGNSGIVANGGSMIVSGVIAQRANQIVFIQNTYQVVRRFMYNGTWSDWVNCSPSAFAPAGYGLGETAARYVDSPELITNSGFYRSLAPDGVKPARYICVALSERGKSIIGFSETNNGEIFTRNMAAGVWQPWEWVNPPMLPGVEYRTTERQNGKAVYTKRVDCGALAAGTSTIDFTEASMVPLSVTAIMYNNNTNIMETLPTSEVSVHLSGRQIVITSTTAYSYKDVYAFVKYYD